MPDYRIRSPYQIAFAPGEGLVIAGDEETVRLHVTTIGAAKELLECAALLYASMLDDGAERIAVTPTRRSA